MPVTQQTALITGASSGIGAQLARLFASDGYRLILVARNRLRLSRLQSKLESEFGGSVLVFPMDLANSESTQALIERLRDESPAITALVNNAGFGISGRFQESSLERQLEMIRVNVEALTLLTHLLLPQIRAAGRGEILNVASTAAFQPGPLMAVYYATKAYVLHFTEALAEELAGEDVRITCLCPGPTDTPFQAKAGLEDRLLFRLGTMKAADVAQAGYRALKKSKLICVPGWRNKLGVLSVRFAPRFLVRKLVRRLQSCPGRNLGG